ncbi:ribbon-helix-helix protein, CopG family [Anoxynatronum buryatiense]|uniref:CopG family transcriptional regulator / antitoxin EndoAI n=1 Tax=Anoxynatronum buryatiense TaxID=489973 RepID=A0AA45WTX4_9CLOT|nr:ribbon-helix-helix protein, CopG family [Anoxynatronum buryatiense]SMP45170.1 CopG family transcriptional regulator / antitoxin EndoAI [Anoxynatronum buryatiense]
MKNHEKELTIRLPENMLQELDVYSHLENKNLNEFIREAVQQILCEKNRCQLHENMRIGYEEMGAINLALAEIGVCIERTLLEEYELRCPEWKEGSC